MYSVKYEPNLYTLELTNFNDHAFSVLNIKVSLLSSRFCFRNECSEAG